MVAFTAGWLVIVVGLDDLGEGRNGIPFGTWSLLWVLVGLTSGRVLTVIHKLDRRPWPLHRKLAWLVTLLLTWCLALGLWQILLACDPPLAGLGSSIRTHTCPADAEMRGWIELWAAFGVLCSAATYVFSTTSSKRSAADNLP
jgi:hypothetical protein